jgi:membrane fusion protein, heavy metal efflux system
MTLRFAAATIGIACSCACLTACREAESAAGAAAPAKTATAPVDDTAPASRGVVRLDASQLQQVHIEELAVDSSAAAIKATGTVEFNADRMAKLLPPVPGQVQDLAVNVGDSVHKDQVLFVLSSRDVAAAVADHVASEKDAELAAKNFAMTQDLFEHDVASRMALAQSESELAKARSKVMQTAETLRVLGLDPHTGDAPMTAPPRVPVRTPIDGTVIDRTVTTGQFVGNESSPLMTIADLSSVWVQGDIFERDLRHITVGQKADVTTAAYPADQFSAEVSRIASIVDAQTRTAKVRFLVANVAARLKPGMFASISLHVSDGASFLTIPAKAVFVEDGQTYAYVQTGPGAFARRRVDTAVSGSDRLRVVSGVEAGDRVISDGALLLRQLEADAPAQ